VFGQAPALGVSGKRLFRKQNTHGWLTRESGLRGKRSGQILYRVSILIHPHTKLQFSVQRRDERISFWLWICHTGLPPPRRRRHPKYFGGLRQGIAEYCGECTLIYEGVSDKIWRTRCPLI
jgi:hypothetical protein